MSSHVRVLRLMFMGKKTHLFEAKTKSKSTCWGSFFILKTEITCFYKYDRKNTDRNTRKASFKSAKIIAAPPTKLFPKFN